MKKVKPEIVLLDQDGPLADFEEGFLSLYRREFPDLPFVPIGERKNFYHRHDYPVELAEKVKEILFHQDLYINLPVVPGAQKAVEKMLSKGVNVRVCTSPLLGNDYCASQKLIWLERNFDKDFAERAHIGKDKGYVIGDYLVDDKETPNCRYPKKTWKHVLFDAVYNVGAVNDLRIMNWTDESYLEVLGIE